MNMEFHNRCDVDFIFSDNSWNDVLLNVSFGYVIPSKISSITIPMNLKDDYRVWTEDINGIASSKSIYIYLNKDLTVGMCTCDKIPQLCNHR